MNFDDAKKNLAKNYESNGFEIIEIGDVYILLQYSKRNTKFIINEPDIVRFSEFEDRRSEYTKPVECGICSKDYREQIVEEIGTSKSFLLLNESGFAFGQEIHESEDDSVYVNIARASDEFMNYFRFEQKYLELCKDRIQIRYVSRNPTDAEPFDINDILFRPLTIRVSRLGKQNAQEALKLSTNIIESCFFDLSYINHIALWLVETWPLTRRNKILGNHAKIQRKLQLPKTAYNADLVRFYQLARSSEGFPILQFLAYYQILEYFFLTVSDEQLYERIFQHINDPKFSNSRQRYDQLIQEISDHRQVTDEKQMLKNVISKFVNLADIREFIRQFDENYAKSKGDKHYNFNKKKTIFGESPKISPDSPDEHFLAEIVQRIKLVRNALVHSSDRYSRSDKRHIPFSESAKAVSEEIPLVEFLAEKVIIATAEKDF